MTTPKKFRGYWWLPSDPENQWLGSFRWRAGDSPALKLTYKTADAATAPPDTTVESFLGFDAGGAPFSVLRAGWAGSRSAGFLSSRKYQAGHALKGIHIGSWNDFRVHRVNFWVQHLSAWFNEDGFQATDERDGAWRIEYRRPKDRSFQVSEGVTLKLCHSASSSSGSRERAIRYDLFFAVEKKRSFGWPQLFRWIDAMKSLLHFACLRPVKSTRITFENFDQTFALGERGHPKEIELMSGAVAESAKKSLREFDFVFAFKDVADRFSELCAQWFRFCVQQREALGCYLTTVYFDLLDEVEIVCLTQALEAFHERRYHPAGKAKLFENRILLLCELHGSRLKPVVGALEAFAATVKASRHYYTHHDPAIRAKGNVASGSKLTMMVAHLRFLFRLCVLGEFRLETDRHSMLRRQIPGRIIEYY